MFGQTVSFFECLNIVTARGDTIPDFDLVTRAADEAGRISVLRRLQVEPSPPDHVGSVHGLVAAWHSPPAQEGLRWRWRMGVLRAGRHAHWGTMSINSLIHIQGDELNTTLVR